MPATWTIGDIHGCIRTFRYMVEELLHIQPGDTLVLLGDLIDRGPDSKAVIDLCLDLRYGGVILHALRGNHEEMLLRADESDDAFNQWMRNSGMTTLHDFGVQCDTFTGREALKEIPVRYMDFFRQMPYYLETNNAFLVHAGINEILDNPLDDTDTMIWIRQESYHMPFLKNRKLIHGHTPWPVKRVLAQQYAPSRLVYNLDAGCIHTGFPGYSHLAAMNLETGEIKATPNQE